MAESSPDQTSRVIWIYYRHFNSKNPDVIPRQLKFRAKQKSRAFADDFRLLTYKMPHLFPEESSHFRISNGVE